MRKSLHVFFVLILLWNRSNLSAASNPSFVRELPRCASALFENPYPYQTVYRTLSLYKVRQELWALIAEDLALFGRSVPERMALLASREIPNPLIYPVNLPWIEQTLRIILLNGISTILSERYPMVGTEVYQPLFDSVLRSHEALWVQCFPKNPPGSR